MRKSLLIISAISLFFVSGYGYAANFKVGVIDIQKILQKIPQINTADSAFKKKFLPHELTLKASQKKLERDIATLKAGKAKITVDQKDAAQEKINTEPSDLQISQSQYAQDMHSAQARSMRHILSKVKSKVNQVSHSGGYDLVLPKSSTIYF